jgi:WD40 repeat protein
MPLNAAKFKLRYQLTFEPSWVTTVAFLSPTRLAAGNQLGQIYVWDLPSMPPAFDPTKSDVKDRTSPDVRPIRRLEGHQNEITRLLCTPDGKTLISASLDRTIRVWANDAPATGKMDVVLDSESRQRAAKRAGKKEPVSTTGFSIETQTATATLQGHGDWIYALGLNADATRLISGDTSAQIIVWDLLERKSLQQWKGLPWNWIVSAALSPDGSTALVSEYRYKRDDFDIPSPGLKLINVADGKVKLDFMKAQFPKFSEEDRTYGGSQLWRKFVANGLICSAFSPDGKLVAVGQGGETDTGKVHLLDTATGKLVRDLASHMGGLTDLLFSRDGKHLLTVGRDTSLRISEVESGKELVALGGARGGQFKDWLSSLAISPDDRMLSASDISGVVQVWGTTE